MSEPDPRPPVIRQVEDVLRRARKLPAGPTRNDLRQFAQALLKLHRAGVEIEEDTRLTQ
jgi:hypothetical protein